MSGLSGVDWVRQHFADISAPTMTGDLAGRVTVTSPTLFDNAHITGDKYGIDDLGSSFGVVDSTIEGQQPRPGDPTGASIRARDGSSPAVGYLANVTLNPGFPPWQSYSTTNFDGIDFDAEGPGSALYTYDVTVVDWADAALDIKAEKSQHVGLTVQTPPDGPGNRVLRFWGPGPHYLVDSAIDGGPTLIWVSAAAGANFELRVWNSTFAGQSTVPAGRAVSDDGSIPRITYLDHDPRTTGEMHEMFLRDDGAPPPSPDPTPASTITFTGVMSQTFDVSGTVTIQPDASLSAEKVSYLYIDGTKTGSGAYSPPYAQTLDTTTLADSDHTVSGTYRRGGVDYAFSFQIRVNNTNPTPTSTILFTGESGQSYSVSGEVTVKPDLDVLKNVRKVSPFYVNGTKTGSGAYSAPFAQTLVLSPGTYTISMSYTDDTGDHSFWFTLDVR